MKIKTSKAVKRQDESRSSLVSTLYVTIKPRDEQEGNLPADTASARVLHRQTAGKMCVPSVLHCSQKYNCAFQTSDIKNAHAHTSLRLVYL